MTLNRNPTNFFAETEQVAFHVGPPRARHRGHRRPADAGPPVQLPRHAAHPPRRAELQPDPDQPAGRAGERQPPRRLHAAGGATTAARRTCRTASAAAARSSPAPRTAATCTCPRPVDGAEDPGAGPGRRLRAGDDVLAQPDRGRAGPHRRRVHVRARQGRRPGRRRPDGRPPRPGRRRSSRAGSPTASACRPGGHPHDRASPDAADGLDAVAGAGDGHRGRVPGRRPGRADPRQRRLRPRRHPRAARTRSLAAGVAAARGRHRTRARSPARPQGRRADRRPLVPHRLLGRGRRDRRRRRSRPRRRTRRSSPTCRGATATTSRSARGATAPSCSTPPASGSRTRRVVDERTGHEDLRQDVLGAHGRPPALGASRRPPHPRRARRRPDDAQRDRPHPRRPPRVEELFEEFDASQDGAVIGQILDMLTAHDDAEHGALYPLALDLLGGGDVLDRSLAAHTCGEEADGPPEVPRGTAPGRAVRGAAPLVADHVQDEEQNLLPALAEAASDAELDTLGARILQAKQRGG